MASLPQVSPQQPPYEQKKRKPFVVAAPATMLKKNPQFSKHARNLCMTLLALADGKTGQLRINGRWLKATVFDRAAEMCRDIRMRAMRELVAAGNVTVERPLVRRTINGRMRAVLAEAQYTVHREPVPKIDSKPSNSSKVDLLKSIPTTVDGSNSQYVSNPPNPMVPGAVSVFALGGAGVPPANSEVASVSSSSKAPEKKPDDDDDRVHITNVNPKPNSSVDAKDELSKDIALYRAWMDRHPECAKWMDTQILKRATSHVYNRGSYLRKARPAFLDNLDDETEQYLQAKAEEFMTQHIEKNGEVCWDQVEEFLKKEVLWHWLPVGRWDGPEGESIGGSVTHEDPWHVYCRIHDNACEVLHLVNVEAS